MDKIVDLFNNLPVGGKRKDDDFVDRLSNKFTVVLLLVFAIVVSFQQYGGSPIICWAPVHFTGSHIKYTNSYCWVRNTYYLPYEENIPKEHEWRQVLPYYQWIPFVLLIQAFLFFFPSVVWHGFNQRSGVDADNILATANTLAKTDKAEKKESILKLITNQMDRFLGMRRDYGTDSTTKMFSRICCHMCGKRFGSYLIILFLFTKVLYIINVFFQFIMLNYILGYNYSIYGFAVLSGFAGDTDWHNNPFDAFPRVTMCDFRIRRLGNVHRYTVQCTLPINLFNEKIFLFLWFWMIMIMFISVVGFGVWLVRFFSRGDRLKFTQNRLQLTGRLPQSTKTERKLWKLSARFVDLYLKQDGVFLIRLVAHNTNQMIANEIVSSLWDKWLEKLPENQKGLLPDAPRDSKEDYASDATDDSPY